MTQSAAGGYQTGLNVSLVARAESEAGSSEDEALLIDDEEPADNKQTLDDKMAADNDNVGEDPIPDMNETDEKPATKARRTVSSTKTKAPTDTTPMPAVKLKKFNNKAGGH